MNDVGKTYGAIRALKGINLTVNAGDVTCVLGDNGAGKSPSSRSSPVCTRTTRASMKVDGGAVNFTSPRDALGHGIATVYQDLAVVSLMEVWHNFFLGRRWSPAKAPAVSR